MAKNAALRKLSWVEAVFSINGGEDVHKNYQVMVTGDVVDYEQLLDEIVHPFIKPDIRVIPKSITPGSICGDYRYAIDTISVNLKEVNIITSNHF